MKLLDGTLYWHIYPLGFFGADQSAGRQESQVLHRLSQLEPWLDYVAELGCSGLQLGPIFASETHGYDTIDYFRIDPRLGDERDFRHLAEAAQQRGLTLVLDGVFNHVGRSFEMFQRACEEGPDSEAARWFYLYWNEGDTHAPDPQSLNAEVFEGHHALVKLNHHEAQVADYVAQVMAYWLERGAGGWRLDAAYAVAPQFWGQVIPRVRQQFPDAYFVGEVIHGDYVGILQQSAADAQAGLDAVTQYELWKAIWSSLNDRNFFELTSSLERHETFLQHMVPMTFLSNHDVTRIASKLTDTRHLPHALAVLMTVGGTPSIYAGDEQAMLGVKEDRPGGDDAVRPQFPENPADLPPAGSATYELYRQLIALRRKRPWLADAVTEVRSRTNTTLVYRSTARIDAQQSIDVALNLEDNPLPLPGVGWQSLAGIAESGTSAVPPHGWAIGHLSN